MKLLVFSDSHNDITSMPPAAARHADAAACFFLGDGTRGADVLAERFPTMPLYRVRGNCDFGSFDPDEGLVPCAGHLIFYTHGNLHGAKSGTSGLLRAAKSRDADIVLFGHTHRAFYEKYNGVHLFNPGSISMPRGGPASYGLITLGDGGGEACETNGKSGAVTGGPLFERLPL